MTIMQSKPFTADEMLVLSEINMLVKFMQGPDNAVLVRLISFFSVPTLPEENRSLKVTAVHPRELKPFWDSLTQSEKDYYRVLAGHGYI